MERKEFLKNELIGAIEKVVDRWIVELEEKYSFKTTIHDFNYMRYFRVQEASSYIIGRLEVCLLIKKNIRLKELEAKKRVLIDQISQEIKDQEVLKIQQEMVLINKEIVLIKELLKER